MFMVSLNLQITVVTAGGIYDRSPHLPTLRQTMALPHTLVQTLYIEDDAHSQRVKRFFVVCCGSLVLLVVRYHGFVTRRMSKLSPNAAVWWFLTPPPPETFSLFKQSK